MSFRGLIPYLVFGVFLIGAAVYASMVMRPALRDARDAVARGELLATESTGRLDRVVGELYAKSLHLARARSDDVLSDLRTDLEEQGRQLRRWFSRLNLADNAPPPSGEDFAAAYAFHRDELVREIVRLAGKSTGKEPTEIPLLVPAFVAESRLPADAAEMMTAQRIFNIQTLLLTQAAAKGAVPVAPPQIAEGWPAWSTENRFRETKAVLRFEVADRRVPVLLRTLIELERRGPMVRLAAMATRPRPLPKTLGPMERPNIEVEVRLNIYEYIPEPAAPSGEKP